MADKGTPTPFLSAKLKVRAVGILLIAALAGVFVLTGAFYNQAFDDTIEIKVETARSGLIMDPGNTVKYRGVEVGRVTEVDKSDDGATLTLLVSRDRAQEISGNVGAEIRATTIFGAKYVELVDSAFPEDPTDQALAADTVIDARSVTTEVNTLFESLDGVLSTVDVVQLNTTLETLSTTLSGRGERLAELAATADRYLTELEPELPQLRQALRDLADLSDLGVRLEPALIEILDNATVTSRTLTTKRTALDRVLVDAALLGDTATQVLGVNTDPLVRNLKLLRPTTRLLSDYASELPCFLKGLEVSGKLARDVTGGTSPFLNLIATLRTQLPPYDPATDKPQVRKGSGPTCGQLPYLGAKNIPAKDAGPNRAEG